MQVFAWYTNASHWTERELLTAGVILPFLIFLYIALTLCFIRFKKTSAQTAHAMQALEEQVRPVLKLEKQNDDLGWRAPGQRIVLKNSGAGAAFHTVVELYRGSFDQSMGTYFGFEPFVIPPDQSIAFAFPAYMAYSLMVVYQSVKGDRFSTNVSFPDGEMRITLQQGTTDAVSSTPFTAGLIRTANARHLFGGPLI